jgi:hypothetical protein
MKNLKNINNLKNFKDLKNLNYMKNIEKYVISNKKYEKFRKFK